MSKKRELQNLNIYEYIYGFFTTIVFLHIYLYKENCNNYIKLNQIYKLRIIDIKKDY